MFLLDAEILCPACGETISIEIDPSSERQDLIEDCSVCCRPMRIRVRLSDGAIADLSVEPS